MISRRNFLKIAGLSSVAIAAGFTTGKLTGNSKSVNFVLHGFIPADENVIADLVSSFKNKVKSSANPLIFSDSKIGEFVMRLHSQTSNNSYPGNGKVIYRIKRLNKQVDSDIIISDSENPIYSINDWNFSFSELRSKIKNRKADFLFTAEYREEDFISSLFKLNKKEVVIENEKGLVEKISLDKNYKNILIDGPQGKTGLKIENGIAQVHTSTCRHGICKHSVASGVGNIIACAPNKVLIKVV
ncbi:NusG domain II-containing protein [Ignavibacterium sp.]|uniref:NusG domain II-containing protein n=1 Tax=Ignavibacterium sp. TaxID=2651167 RepID=UPI00307D20F4